MDVLSVARAHELPIGVPGKGSTTRPSGCRIMCWKGIPGTDGSAQLDGGHHRRGGRQGSGRDGISLTREGTIYHLGVAYRGCEQLRSGGKRPGPGGPETGNQRLSGGPGDPHAAHAALQRDLLPESGGGPAGAQLPDDHRRPGPGHQSSDCGDGDPGEPPDDLHGGEKDSGRRSGNRLRLSGAGAAVL